MSILLGSLLGCALAVALIAVAGSLAEVRRLRKLLREERQAGDWQAAILARRGWRRDAGSVGPKGPHKPRLWRHDPPRQG